MNVWFGLLLISLHWSAVFLESTITDPSGSVDRGIESAITDPSGSVDGGIESAITDPSGSVDRGIESAITDPSGSGDGDDIFGTTANIDSNKDSLAITASYSNEETSKSTFSLREKGLSIQNSSFLPETIFPLSTNSTKENNTYTSESTAIKLELKSENGYQSESAMPYDEIDKTEADQKITFPQTLPPGLDTTKGVNNVVRDITSQSNLETQNARISISDDMSHLLTHHGDVFSEVRSEIPRQFYDQKTVVRELSSEHFSTTTKNINPPDVSTNQLTGDYNTTVIVDIPSFSNDASTHDIPSFRSESSTNDLPSFRSESSTHDIPSFRSESSTNDLPSFRSESSTHDIPSFRSESSTHDIPSFRSESSTHDIPSFRSESSTHDIPSFRSESSTHDIPSFRSESSTYDIPSFRSESSTHDIPSFRSESSTHDIPSFRSESSTHDIPSFRSESSTHDIPSFRSESSTNDLPSFRSESSTHDIPSFRSESSTHDIPSFRSESSTHDIPSFRSESSTYDIPSYRSESSTHDIPSFRSESSTYDIPSYRSESSTHDIPSFRSESSTYDIPSFRSESSTHDIPSFRSESSTHDIPSFRSESSTHDIPSFRSESSTHDIPSFRSESSTHDIPSFRSESSTHDIPSFRSESSTHDIPSFRSESSTHDIPSFRSESSTHDIPSFRSESSTHDIPSFRSESSTHDIPSFRSESSTHDIPSFSIDASTSEHLVSNASFVTTERLTGKQSPKGTTEYQVAVSSGIPYHNTTSQDKIEVLLSEGFLRTEHEIEKVSADYQTTASGEISTPQDVTEGFLNEVVNTSQTKELPEIVSTKVTADNMVTLSVVNSSGGAASQYETTSVFNHGFVTAEMEGDDIVTKNDQTAVTGDVTSHNILSPSNAARHYELDSSSNTSLTATKAPFLVNSTEKEGILAETVSTTPINITEQKSDYNTLSSKVLDRKHPLSSVTTPSFVETQTSVEQTVSSYYNFSASIAEIKPCFITFRIDLSLPNQTECQQINVSQSADVSSEVCDRSGIHVIQTTKLNIGSCYNLTITIGIKTADKTDKTIGPQYYYSCTKPKPPEVGSKVLNRTANSLTVQIEHPGKGTFDSFEININGINHAYDRSRDENTVVELSNLQPGECYNVTIYTVLKGEKSNNPRDLPNECLYPSSPGKTFTVVYNISSFTITWTPPAGYYDQFLVAVKCQSAFKYSDTVKLNSSNVFGVTPGDCCRVEVTTQSHQLNSTPQLYYVHVNESVPDRVIIKNVSSSKSQLFLGWTQPVKTNGWILGYRVKMYNNMRKQMYTIDINCTEGQGSCSKMFTQQMFQCSKYNLTNDRSQARFQMTESSFNLTIHGLQPGLMYYYSIVAFNAKGNSSTGKRNISTPEDISEPPASIIISVLNTTSINVSWSPPNKPNGVLISYKVSYGIVGGQLVSRTVGVDKTSVLLSALNCWTQYNICVSAINSVGDSQVKCGQANTSVYKPKSEIKSVVAVGSSSVTLDFVIPCNYSQLPISYNVSYTALSHERGQQMTCSFLKECKITRLYSFWDYNVKVLERFGNIDGPWSVVWKVKTLASFPEPPASISISVLNITSMNVSWSPPNKPNGVLISYYVTYGINMTVEVNETSVLLSGLDCWTQYNVCVSAINSVGFSQGKCDIANTTVYELKSLVKSVEARGSSSVWIEFEIPCESDHIPPIYYNISYTARSHESSQQNPNNITKWQKCLFKKPCEIMGLYSFWDYYIQVQERVEDKIGPWSEVFQVKTSESLPEPPASISISVLNITSMNVSWSPPNKPNGVLISYKVTYGIIGRLFVSMTVGVEETSVLLSGLGCWMKYVVFVSAKNSVGLSKTLRETANTTVYEPKSQVKSVEPSGSSSILLKFEIPCESNDIPIYYNISYTAMSNNCIQQNSPNITELKECSYRESCYIIGLYSFWDYYVQVQERFGDIIGPWSDVFPVKTYKNYPDEVRNLEIRIYESDSLTVCWDVPCFLNGHFVEYKITLDGQSRTSGTETCSTIDALMPYTYYNISVTVVNDFGRSQALHVVGRTDIAKPSKPNITKIHIDSRKVKVDWSPLNLYPGPMNYTLEVKDNKSGVISSCYSSSFNLTTCTVDGLEEYWPYEVTVTARTKKGENSSVIRSMRTLEAAPGPVTNLSVKPEMNPENPRQIYIQFLAPELRHQNGILKAYYIICKAVQSGEIISVTKLEREAETKIPVPHQLLLNISVFGETIENGTVVFRTVIVPEGAKRFPVAGAVAGMLTAVVFIVVAVIIAIFYRKQMFCFKAPLKVKEAIGMNAVKPKKKTSGENVDKRKNRPIKNDRFYQHVEIMARDSNNFFAKEYKELKDLAPNLPTEAAQQQDARAKNRYSNILPFDHSRVKLLPFDDDEGSDYINANYIPGFNSQREYIATQGPLPSTKDDFWRMIWEQNVSVIVMLTQCVERGKRKCECYWPECVREPVYFGDLCIETETESHLPEYVLRTMKISLGNVTKCITHFLYLAWPDMGVPSSTDSMISLVKTVRSHVNPSMKGPMTVHCSAGVGRTGTFIAVDILLHKLDSDYNQMDIFGDVLTLRNYRCNMVQTEDQYIFIHHCISDYILALSEETDEEEAADGGDEPVYQNVIKK